MKIDFTAIGLALADQAVQSLQNLAEGAQEDLRNFGVAIANDMVAALQEPEEQRQALITELIGQVRALAELTRIRANDAAWAEIRAALRATLETAARLIPVLLASA